jgi:peptide/nickel transport system substrate-binding protein
VDSGAATSISRIGGFATLALALAVALAGCARAKPLAPSDYLQVDVPTSPVTLDPRIAADAISDRIDELIYDPLVRVAPDGTYRGDLAASIERPDPLRLIFHLRRGVRFSDGRELTARDVVFTYQSLANPATRSLKTAGLAEMKSIRALDADTVEMTTRRPYAPALQIATYDIVPADSPPPGGPAESIPPGTGPFRLARFARDEGVVLARNQFRPYPRDSARGLFIKVVPDATVRALELAEGICDFAENDAIQPDLVPYLSIRPDLALNQSPGTTFAYLAFNFRDPRLRDVRLRRAIAYAIDRGAIVSAMMRGTARVATGMLTPENWAYAGDVARYPYNPAMARRLLEQAGYRPGDPRLRFDYATTPEGWRLAEALQDMLQRVGIVLDIRTTEWATYYGDLRRGAFDLTSSQWVGVSDPHQYYLIFDSKMTPPRGDNRGAYSNPEMDRLLEAGDAALDPARRGAIYARVQKLAASELPYVPLWWMNTVVVASRRVSGFRSYPDGSLDSLATAGYVPGAARRRFGD